MTVSHIIRTAAVVLATAALAAPAAVARPAIDQGNFSGDNAAAVDHIVISPNNATITAGGSQSYTAQAFDAANNSLGDVTATTTFTAGTATPPMCQTVSVQFGTAIPCGSAETKICSAT